MERAGPLNGALWVNYGVLWLQYMFQRAFYTGVYLFSELYRKLYGCVRKYTEIGK